MRSPVAEIDARFVLNGVRVSVRAHPMARLLDVLRERGGCNGVKEGCGEGECGACSVLMGGEVVNSCLVPFAQAEGTEIVTVEGLAAAGGRLSALQEAFLACGGAQCGICTPGMVVAASALLARNSAPTDAEIREGLAGNLCRCTGYVKIVDAVRAASAGGRRAAVRADVERAR